MGKYLIFEQGKAGLEAQGQPWYEAGIVEGSSAEAAIRAHVIKMGKSASGVYLAIPDRSAKTIRVKVETVQKVSVDAGKDAS